MWRGLVILCAICQIAVMYIIEPGPKFPPTKGEVWPKAQQEKKNSTFYTYRPSIFEVEIIHKSCDILTKAVERYTWLLKKLYNINRRNHLHSKKRLTSLSNQEMIQKLRIDLTSACQEYPDFDMDEHYTLDVSASSSLSSASIWGIIRGLETFSQLFYISDDYNEFVVNATKIVDYPQYKHRGLLLDTGRHYISLNNIFKTLDAMAMNKMNVFHWHIVDDQSFPYQSTKFPALSEKGAFHPSMVYTKADIKMVIEYARDRAIRVVPEIDMPAHTRSWGVAFPSILTKCYMNDKVYALGPLNPINNATYKLLRDLLHEVQKNFPDNYLHVGGDEVGFDCWKSNPELKDYMSKNKLTANQLHSLFMTRVINLLSNESIPMVWQEVFDENVPISKDTLVQVWRNGWVSEMIKILSAGHRVVFSSSWYLDYLEYGWESFYEADPRQMVYKLKHNLPLENIVGGEACMWGEMADDTVVISRTWPRASAVAERLWTGLDYKNYKSKYLATNEVRRRIEEHTCRMNQRDIAAQPPNGPGFCIV